MDYVPLAMRIKGKIIDKKDVDFEASSAYFLIPKPDLEEVAPYLERGNCIKLILAKKNKCIKFEKIS